MGVRGPADAIEEASVHRHDGLHFPGRAGWFSSRKTRLREPGELLSLAISTILKAAEHIPAGYKKKLRAEWGQYPQSQDHPGVHMLEYISWQAS